ncbi:hypothetical protein PHISCL_02379 [Aspergillus sclerotialis]|uniref:GPI mannosyltransferase 2 n=1 Tax=Aspergillus sclerotialis TaxID=2070753 RepID=A0A3A2ZRG9_9EURO|nr:hypothetical protein PHISCL_02379 [Aspergillus sclerotialis]
MTSPSKQSKRADSRSASLNPVGLLSFRQPVRSLTIAFWIWKAIVFLAAVACPGPGYDTSTTLLPDPTTGTLDVTPGIKRADSLSVPLRFVRWDSIYYVDIAENGYVFEQEWAFGYGYTKVLRFLSPILALYRLTLNVFGHQTAPQRLLAYVSAALHIISPAGAFLSAPYGESLFSFLNLSGFYIYSSALYDDRIGKGSFRNAKVLTSAVLFAAATMVRSNGILSGFLFAYDALMLAWRIMSDGPSVKVLARLGVTILGGCVVAVGMVWPQFVAYTTYCITEGVSRPWCQWTIPSIYGWVQDHYW